MSDDDRTLLMEAWDRLDNAAQRMLVALPDAMTSAASRLDHERLNMRSVVQSVLVRGRK
jgi:hypothetical protein